ncbi:hypothetical protein LguiA_002606 [Lonicera macranthoides]
MAHSLAPATAVIPISTTISKKTTTTSGSIPSVFFQRVWACSQGSNSNQAPDQSLVQRRIITLGLAGAALGLNIGSNQSANAAARRPPPPPPTEKKDPNVSGVTAKILASKKRKEAMKDAVAKMRESGKAIKEP